MKIAWGSNQPTFLLSNNSYNLISDKNKKLLIKIRELGHKISLHFDMMIYDNILEALEESRKFLIKFLTKKLIS